MKPPVGNGSYIVKWGGDGKCRGRMMGIWNTLNSLELLTEWEFQNWNGVWREWKRLRIGRGGDKEFLENTMASNGEGRVRPGNSYYFLFLSISPGGQFSPVTLRSSRVRGIKVSGQKRVLKKGRKEWTRGWANWGSWRGLLQGWVFVNKKKQFLQQ